MPFSAIKFFLRSLMILLFACTINMTSAYSQTVRTWKKVTLPQSIASGYFLDIFFLPSQPEYGWACGFDGYIARTTDGGNTWRASIIAGRPFLESIHFVDTLHGFASGPGGVFKTLNGGLTWLNISVNNLTSQVWGCYFVDKDNGMFVGGGCSLTEQLFARTTNGGSSWTFFEGNEFESGLADVILYSKDGLGYAVSSGLLWRTLDGGKSWNVFATISGPRAWAEELTHINNSFLTPFAGDDCFGGARNVGGANFTTDNGKSWNTFTTNKSMFGSFLIDEKKGWICGDLGEVLYTSNAGIQWDKYNCGLNGANIDDIWFVNDSLGWAVGQGIFKFSYTELPRDFIKTPPMPYCFGDTVRLELSDEFENIVWNSSGSSQPTTLITTNTTVMVRAFHKPTCTIVYDTLNVLFNNPVQANLNVRKDTILCENDILTIKVEGTYDSLLWYDGTNDTEKVYDRNSNPSGLYVDVFDSLKCSRRLKIPAITWNNTRKPTIQHSGKTILCNLDSTELVAPSGYRSYVWNTGDTKQSIMVKDAGRYHVVLTDSIGCILFSDTLTIERINLDNYLSASISGKTSLEFDTTIVSGKTCITLTFTNKNPISNYTLELPYIRRNIEFSMPMSQFPINIKPLDSLTLDICFSPDSIGIWRDTIVFRDTCSSLVYPLIGYGKPYEISDFIKCGIEVNSYVISNGQALYCEFLPHPIQSNAVLMLQDDINVQSIDFYDVYGRKHRISMQSYLSVNRRIPLTFDIPSGIYVPLIHTNVGIIQMNPIMISP
jgi:photosystem II stability/assembly factor-like uncharacterized protein